MAGPPGELVEWDGGLAVVPDWNDTDEVDDTGEDGLLSRLSVIAGQPLAERADALAQLHDELRSRLESADGSSGSTRA